MLAQGLSEACRDLGVNVEEDDEALRPSGVSDPRKAEVRPSPGAAYRP
jgi:hypothetical protein